MPWAKFRKKPVAIDAILWDGRDETLDAIRAGHKGPPVRPSLSRNNDRGLWIDTLEGVRRVNKGDWVIRGVCGELSPCKPEIFESRYEGAE